MRLSIPILVFVSLLLTACGFQLRGLNQNLSEQFSSVYLPEASNKSFQEKIGKFIASAGGKVVNKENATTAVYLSPITTSSRQISLASNGSLKEYERTYKISVTIVNMTDGAQLGSRNIVNTQYLQLDELSPQSGEEQTRLSQTAAENDLAQEVISYLSSF